MGAPTWSVGPVCKNLVRVFQLSRGAKAPGADEAEGAAVGRAAARRRRRRDGRGIAELASRHGIEVRLRDADPAALARALRSLRARIASARRRRADGARTRRRRSWRASMPTLEPAGLGRADLAIEAAVEDLDVKRRVFGELEVRMRPDAVLATNTSSLWVDELAAGLAHPERFVGLHFLRPVQRRPLVEVVRGAKTSDATLATAVALARRLGKDAGRGEGRARLRREPRR